MSNPTLDILASGSAANGYVVTAGNERLLIECGVKPSEILKAFNYKISSVRACLVSHAHRPRSLKVYKGNTRIHDTHLLQFRCS